MKMFISFTILIALVPTGVIAAISAMGGDVMAGLAVMSSSVTALLVGVWVGSPDESAGREYHGEERSS